MVSFALNENKALSMSFQGKLDKHDARIFLDSGATHDFIDKAYASSHNLIV
jgi:hypothetical protein